MADIVDILVDKTEELVTIDVTTNETIVNISTISGSLVDSVNGQTGDVVLDADDIAETASRFWLTSALKTAYDSAVTWISTNGTNLLNHLSNTSNPHSTTATQVDALKRDGSNANSNIDIGEYELKAGQFEFDQTPTGTSGEAIMRWNDQDGTLDLGLKGGNVTLQIGQESVIRVVNKTGANLLEANYQAVRVDGAQGNRLKIALAQATTDLLSAETIGLVTETINDNQEGFVTTNGLVRNINTTGSLQGETWADGDMLYLSPTVAGRLTKVKPTAPNHLVVIGYVVRAHSTQGQIFVKVDNGYELDELHNVAISSPVNNQALTYNSATDVWENKTLIQDSITDGVTTIAPSQNAVFDALATKQDTLTNPITGTGASGRVAFFNGTTTQLGDNGLFWDNTNKRLGVGTNTPDRPLHINSAGITGLRIDVTGGGSNAIFLGNQSSLIRWSNGSYFSNTGIYSVTNDQQYITFDGTNTQVRLHITASNGNVGIGTTSPQSRLDVRAQGALSTDIAFRVRNSADTANLIIVDGIGQTIITPSALTGSAATNALDIAQTWNTTGTPTLIRANVTDTASNTNSNLMDLRVANTSVFSVRKSGALSFGNNSSLLLPEGTTASDSRLLIRGGQGGAVGSIPLILLTTNNNITSTSGNPVLVSIARDFTPTSGTATYTLASITSTINQTGGANGITRGLFIQPTLTSAADWRSIEWTNNTGRGLWGSGTANNAMAGSLNVGAATNANASAVLEATSTTQGFLPPRMTTTQRNAIASPAAGLIVYDTTLNKLCVRTASAWETITSI